MYQSARFSSAAGIVLALLAGVAGAAQPEVRTRPLTAVTVEPPQEILDGSGSVGAGPPRMEAQEILDASAPTTATADTPLRAKSGQLPGAKRAAP